MIKTPSEANDDSSDSDSSCAVNCQSSPESAGNDDAAESDLLTCDRVMICLSSRRFLIVQPEEPQRDLWPINGGWEKVRKLQPGDAVIYRGSRATVRAVEPF